MILRTIQSVRNRIEATDERSDRVKPGELEVPKLSVSDYRQRSSSVGTGLAVTRGVYEVGAPSCCKSRPAGGPIWNAEAAAPAHPAPAGDLPSGCSTTSLQSIRPAAVSGRASGAGHAVSGGPESNGGQPGSPEVGRVRVKPEISANQGTPGKRVEAPQQVYGWGGVDRVAVGVMSVGGGNTQTDQSKCPICYGPTSSLTGGACLTCRRTMDAAMDAQMKRLADDREFQRELEEASEQLPNTGRTKACAAGCGEQLALNYWSDICGKPECVAWALGEKQRRWDAQTEIAIRMAGRE